MKFLTALGLLAIGLTIEHIASPLPPLSPQREAGDWILAADFHVHGWPGDGSLAPPDLARAARRVGLDVVAVTNHNQTLSAGWIDDEMSGVIVIPSEEVTTPMFHLTAIGVTSTIDWHGSAATIAEAIHAQGGAAIAAHPAREQRRAWTSDALAAMDGVEVAQPMIEANENDRRDLLAVFAAAQRVNPTIAPIGATDFHAVAPIGFCRTYVFARDRSRAAVIAAIRRGATVACDAMGRTYGAASPAARVASACTAASALSTRIDTRPAHLLALILVGAALGRLTF